MSQNNAVIDFKTNSHYTSNVFGHTNRLTPDSVSTDFIMHNYVLSRGEISLYNNRRMGNKGADPTVGNNFGEYSDHDMLSLFDINFLKFFTQDGVLDKNSNIFFSNI